MRIGVFDSGIGGLTVLREVRRHCPGHSTIYLGDTARVPYGSKSPQTIRRYCAANAELLMREGIDYLVVACNTASAHGLDELRGLPIPVCGVIEPGAELAVAQSGGGLIGVLGTQGTVRSGAYDRAIKARSAAARVDSIACSLFVPLVEEGWEDTDIARTTARTYLARWIESKAEKPGAVILGCTHYPILKPVIQETLGEEVVLIDSAIAVASRVRDELAGAPEERKPAHRIFLTDASEGFVRFARRFLKVEETEETEMELVDLEPVLHGAL